MPKIYKNNSNVCDTDKCHVHEPEGYPVLTNPKPGTVRFAVIGDYGSATIDADEVEDERSVAILVDLMNPHFIISAGDNVYPNMDADIVDDSIGQFYSKYIANYQGSYGEGSLSPRFFPVPGNHDYSNDNTLSEYLNYFPDLPGTGFTSSSGNGRYYNFVWENIEFFMLSTDSREADGRTEASTQGQWLESALDASTATFKFIIGHHNPYIIDTTHSVVSDLQWSFKDWGADVYIHGHVHTYARAIVDNFTYVASGLGGHSRRRGSANPITSLITTSAEEYGALFCDVTETQAEFTFLPVSYFSSTNKLIWDRFVIEKPLPIRSQMPRHSNLRRFI